MVYLNKKGLDKLIEDSEENNGSFSRVNNCLFLVKDRSKIREESIRKERVGVYIGILCLVRGGREKIKITSSSMFYEKKDFKYNDSFFPYKEVPCEFLDKVLVERKYAFDISKISMN